MLCPQRGPDSRRGAATAGEALCLVPACATQSTAWLLLRPWPGSLGGLARVAGELGCPTLTENPHGKGLRVHTPKTLFPAGKAKAGSIRPVSMRKWEHSLMQNGRREGVQRGRREGGQGERVGQ